MKPHFYISFLIVLFTVKISSGHSSRVFIWNVGQGQWATWVRDNECLHFDMGGEQAPLSRIRQLCQSRKNSLSLSHSDFDHIRYIYWGIKNLAGLCLVAKPRETLNFKKSNFIQKLNLCSEQRSKQNSKQRSEQAQEINFISTRFKNTNDLSRVYLLKGSGQSILIPGDSTAESEKIWVTQITAAQRLKIHNLILGHHGSRTSTSELLIKNLPNLSLTISSARKRRYGHPHPMVQSRLKKSGIPLAATEVWGNLILELK